MILISLATTLIASVGCSFNSNLKRSISQVNQSKVPEGPEIYPYRVRSEVSHQMKIINNGSEALYERIRMIREAKQTLELEYFIFNPDISGRLVISELIKASRKGVRIRILVDKSMAVFVLDEYYAKILKENKIELRFYNSASLLQISTVQFRNHRKLIVRDGIEAITGGRNIADAYFNLAKKFNFLDRDIWVQGEIVTAMEKSFDNYWNADIVQNPEAPVMPRKFVGSELKEDRKLESLLKAELVAYKNGIAKAQDIMVLSEEDKKALEFVMSYGEKLAIANEAKTCPSVAFATDREGGNFKARINPSNYDKNYRFLRKELALWIGKVENEFILDSPYFLNNDDSRGILQNLLDKEIKVTIFTNSMASSDALIISTVFNDQVKTYTPNKNFNAYAYKGVFSEESELVSDEVKKSVWGIHSKSMIFNDNAFMVGTFNIDNRSNFYNSEMALFCQGSPELKRDVEDSIRFRMKTSYRLNEQGTPEDGGSLFEGTSTTQQIIYYLLKYPSTFMQFLL